MSGFNIDDDAIRKLATLLDETGLTEIEVADGDQKLRVARQAAPAAAAAVATPAPMAMAAPVAAASAPAASDDIASHPGAVKSPMVGVVYLSAEPGKPAFVSTGQTVSEGDTLMLIEAMKTFNPVRAPKSGRVTRVLIGDGEPVEFGEPLVVIE